MLCESRMLTPGNKEAARRDVARLRGRRCRLQAGRQRWRDRDGGFRADTTHWNVCAQNRRAKRRGGPPVAWSPSRHVCLYCASPARGAIHPGGCIAGDPGEYPVRTLSTGHITAAVSRRRARPIRHLDARACPVQRRRGRAHAALTSMYDVCGKYAPRYVDAGGEASHPLSPACVRRDQACTLGHRKIDTDAHNSQ